MKKTTDIHATERDFDCKRKFCSFRISIDHKTLEVVDAGDMLITKDSRNSEMRLSCLGSIKWAPIKQLRLQSASHCSFSGYYVDYADNYDEAKREAISAARELHRKMMLDLDKQLAQMQGTELTFVEHRCCK